MAYKKKSVVVSLVDPAVTDVSKNTEVLMVTKADQIERLNPGDIAGVRATNIINKLIDAYNKK